MLPKDLWRRIWSSVTAPRIGSCRQGIKRSNLSDAVESEILKTNCKRPVHYYGVYDSKRALTKMRLGQFVAPSNLAMSRGSQI